LDEVAEFLAKTFKVEVILAVWSNNSSHPAVEERSGYKRITRNKFSIREQLELVSDASVVITPAGGISFINLFQAVGSSQVTIDHWDGETVREFEKLTPMANR